MAKIPLAVMAAVSAARGCGPGGYEVRVENGHSHQAWVGGCHPLGSRLEWGFDRPAARPFWFEPRQITEPCEVRAYERRGGLIVRSPAVRVDPVRFGVREIVLTLPPDASGGVGHVLEQDERGFVVGEVHPGSPAEGVLSEGDRIWAVDGELAAGWTAWEYLDRAVGPVGSTVTLTIEDEHGLADHTFVRRAVFAPPR
jgi:hypothetical protein